MNPYLKDAIQTKNLRNVKIDTTIPMHEFIPSASKRTPQWYGINIPKKIMEDNKGKIFPMDPREDRGDAYIPSQSKDYDLLLDKYVNLDSILYIEFKTSFTDNETGTKHRITHVRGFQDLTHYIICLVDQEDNYKSRFYFLPKQLIFDMAGTSAMNNTSERNKENKFVDTCFGMEKIELYDIFGKNNLLRGTSYQDLCDYINYMSNTKVLNKTTQQKLTEIKNILKIDSDNRNNLRDKEERVSLISSLLGGKGWARNNVFSLEKIILWEKTSNSNLKLAEKVISNEISINKALEMIETLPISKILEKTLNKSELFDILTHSKMYGNPNVKMNRRTPYKEQIKIAFDINGKKNPRRIQS